jgi:hypothetical protein
MSAENTVETLFNEAYVPMFKQAMAERGIEFKSDGEVVEALKIAAMLRTQPVNDEQAPSLMKMASATLEQAINGPVSKVEQIMQNPKIAALVSK